MTYQKPSGISDEAWANTPPSVQALLAESLAQLNAGDAPHPSIHDTLIADDGGATLAMPPAKTIPTPDDADDGATAFMPLDSGAAAADNEGATVAMPPPAAPLDAEDDGATAYMPVDADHADADDGATAYMPLDAAHPAEDDGATAYRPVDAAQPDDEGATAFMPVEADASNLPTRRVSNQAVKATLISDRPVDDLWPQNIVLQQRYRLRRILGKGGFGAAYLAEDIKLKRGCVVKQMLSPSGVSSQELELNRANFEREAALLVKLNHPGHPNIPEIFDYFSDDSGSYLVMKYIEGQSLKGRLQDTGEALPWQESARHIIDVCSALNYMHTQGEEPVLHRDIKPDNVLLGDDGRIWLVDFGLAQTKPVASTAEIADAQAAGSVGYTPFEQWLGDSTPASDVYAAGVTLHHLVTGVNPIDAYRDDDGKVKINIEKLRDLHSRLDPIRRVNRKLPRELEEIVSRATAAEPDQRLTALQFQQQLEVLVSGAKNAALFTFRNGQSAHTIPELVDLCEQNRVEAQGYLYRGDFARWFSLINRNDLAEAAAEAVKQGEKGKDALEKFLRLIMPNLFLRRLWKAGKNVARVGLQLLLILALAALIVGVVGTLSARWLLQRAIANYNWNYYALDLDEPNIFSQTYLTESAGEATRLYLDGVQVDPQAAGQQVAINANLAGIVGLRVPLLVSFSGSTPRVAINQANGVPLYWIGDNLTGGINQGIAEALSRAPIKITGLTVDDDQVVLLVEKSDSVAYTPPTPVPNATPTPTPRPTPTPPGEALLAVFNDLAQDIAIEIDGDQWVISAHDTKVIEKAPGTYNYVVTYVANGQLAAQGTKTWAYRAYRWRIGLSGESFE